MDSKDCRYRFLLLQSMRAVAEPPANFLLVLKCVSSCVQTTPHELTFRCLSPSQKLEILDLISYHSKKKRAIALGRGLRVGTPLFSDTVPDNYYQELFETLIRNSHPSALSGIQ